MRYSGSLDTVGERVATVPSSWFDGYSDFFTPGLFEQLDSWRIPILEVACCAASVGVLCDASHRDGSRRKV